MADPARSTWDSARRALASLREARSVLDGSLASPLEAAASRRVVERAAERLAAIASEDGCAPELRSTLLDWRDRLGSFVLAAHACDELEVQVDLAEQLLRRGLREILDEAPLRLVGLRPSQIVPA